MTVYIWECEDCGAEFQYDYTRSILKPENTCPKCGEVKLRRVFTPPTLIFKGPGFYVNDKDK